MLHKHRYFDRHGREVAEHEATRAGVLLDGYSLRISAALQDHALRASDGRSFWDQHRASLTDGRSDGVQANRPGFRILTDDDAGRKACVDARAAYIFDLENSWRNPPPRDDAASVVGDAKKKADPPVTGRTKCPECDGSGVVHGKTCQGCGGDGWVDDDEDDEDDADNGETTSDRRMLDVQAVSAAHQQNMARIYQQISDDLSQRWRER